MIKTTKMDINTAIEFTENAVLAGKHGFFVNTEFGRIAFEVESGVINDPTMSVLACPWQDAPETPWAVSKSDRNCDWYCSIAKVKNQFSIHMYCIEAIIRCILMKCIGPDLDDAIVDVAISEYLYLYEDKQLTINFIVKEFEKVHYSGIVKRDPMVKIVTRDWISRRVYDCERVLGNVHKLIELNRDSRIDFTDDFAEVIWGLTMYSVKAGFDYASNRKALVSTIMEEEI